MAALFELSRLLDQNCKGHFQRMSQAADKNASSLHHVELSREDGVQLFDQGHDLHWEIVRQLICSAGANHRKGLTDSSERLQVVGDLDVSRTK